MAAEYVLELKNIFYTGQVEPGTCFQRIMGSLKTGVILKDVSLTVQSGEVLAILGSKGSGKKALLDVISRRIQGPIRGQILLNNQPMSLSVFQQRCGYVTHKCDFIPGLTVEETLYYIPTKTGAYNKKSRVKQVMADLALSQTANRCVENLSKSEYRRLTIGVQLIKEPIILLLDEPTWDLDPLNTYLVISILSNVSKKYGTAVILTMEKPRSDVFPFLEKVLYLCLGDIVYAGGTRQMLDYFNAIGFPCPHLENPLMYYCTVCCGFRQDNKGSKEFLFVVCLSTVDRRSRERFIESNYQIAALVEKFKIEGPAFQKESIPEGNHNDIMSHNSKIPLLQERVSVFKTAWVLYTRLLMATFSFRLAGLKQIFLRLIFVPLYFLLIWAFYRDMSNFQHTFVTRSGFILNSLAVSCFLGIVNTVIIFPVYRTRYYQETQEGLYGGCIFLITYNLVSIPFSFFSLIAASAIIYPLIGSFNEPMEFIYFSLILWACYIFAEQQTISILMIVKDYLTGAICSTYITCVCLALSSGILRSIKGLQDWLFYLTYATQLRYAAAYLNRQIFLHTDLHNPLPFDYSHNCSKTTMIETSNFNGPANMYCRYANGQSFLTERYTRENTDVIFSDILESDFNLSITFAFTLGIIVFNLFLYMIPLPAFLKAKFRD